MRRVDARAAHLPPIPLPGANAPGNRCGIRALWPTRTGTGVPDGLSENVAIARIRRKALIWGEKVFLSNIWKIFYAVGDLAESGAFTCPCAPRSAYSRLCPIRPKGASSRITRKEGLWRKAEPKNDKTDAGFPRIGFIVCGRSVETPITTEAP